MRNSTTLAYMLASFTLGAGIVLVTNVQHATLAPAAQPTTIIHCSPAEWIDTTADETDTTDEAPSGVSSVRLEAL